MRDKNRFLSKTKLLFFIIVLSSFVMGQTAFAEGDGTGGGKSEPLTLVSSSIKDGATGVSLKPEIQLTFSKNIVNMTVNENNKNCFSLLTASGTAIPINLFLADDQIDFEKRNDATITPKANLEQGTTYSVVVSPTLKAKSGVTTGKEIRITFTTEGTKAAPSNNNNNNNPSKTTPKPETQAPKSETPTKPESVKPKVENTPKADSKKNENTTSKVVEKAPTEQNTAETQTKTTEDIPAVEEQPHEDAAMQETAVSAAEPEKGTPYVAAATTNKEKDETQSSNSNNNTSIYILVSSLIVIIAAISIYLRKKRVKSVSR